MDIKVKYCVSWIPAIKLFAKNGLYIKDKYSIAYRGYHA